MSTSIYELNKLMNFVAARLATPANMRSVGVQMKSIDEHHIIQMKWIYPRPVAFHFTYSFNCMQYVFHFVSFPLFLRSLYSHTSSRLCSRFVVSIRKFVFLLFSFIESEKLSLPHELVHFSAFYPAATVVRAPLNQNAWRLNKQSWTWSCWSLDLDLKDRSWIQQ